MENSSSSSSKQTQQLASSIRAQKRPTSERRHAKTAHTVPDKTRDKRRKRSLEVCTLRHDSSAFPPLEEHGNDMALQPFQRMALGPCSESSSHRRQEHPVTQQRNSAFAHVAVLKKLPAAPRPINTQPKLMKICPRHSHSNVPRLLGHTDERAGKSLIIICSPVHCPPLFYHSRPRIRPPFVEAKNVQIHV